MKIWKTMGTLVIAAFLVGCFAPTGTEESPGSGMVITERNVVLKEETLVQPAAAQVQSFDSDTGKITVSDDVAVETGQVFHSGVTNEFPNGALKKVVGVETGADGEKVLITEDAALTDVIENGEYSAEGTLSMEGVKVDSPDNSLVLEDNGETPALLVLDGGLTYAQRFIVNYPITDDVSVRGSFQMALPFNFMLDIKFSELKALDISIEPQFDLDLDIRGSLLNYKHEQSLGTITLQPLTIGVVVITPVVELVLTTTVDGRLEIGVQAKAAFRAGVVYSGETGKWTPYSDKDIDVKFEQPSLVGSIEASMGIKKALKLYGVAGPYFTPEIYAGLKGEYDGSAVSFSAYQGLRARAGGEVTVFNKKVVGIDFTLLDVRSDIELSNKTNLLPDADFSYSKNEISSGVYQVDFTDRSSDDDGSIVSREWDFDSDGVADSAEKSPSRTFRNVKSVVVELMVRDNRMGETSAIKTLIFDESVATHTVSFNSNGGSTVSSQNVAEGGSAAEPMAPARSGYVFSGWYTDSGLSNAWTFGSDTVDSDITLYAKWESQAAGSYTVIFDTNGGSAVSSQQVADGSYAAEPMAPTRSGYVFRGWYGDSGLTNAWDFGSDTVDGDITLYVKWEADGGGNTYEFTTLSGHTDEITSVKFSPNGKILASGSNDGTIIFWDVSTNTAMKTLSGGHDGGVSQIRFSPDGTMLASGTWHSGGIILWNVSTGVIQKELKQTNSSNWYFCFSPDGKTLASSIYDSISFWDISSGTVTSTLSITDGWSVRTLSLDYSPDGKLLAGGIYNSDDSGEVIIWDVSSKEILQTSSDFQYSNNYGVYSVIFSPDGQFLLVVTRSTIDIWQKTSDGFIIIDYIYITSYTKGFTSDVAISPDSKTFVRAKAYYKARTIYTDDGVEGYVFDDGPYFDIEIIDIYTGNVQKTLSGYTSNVKALNFSPDGKLLSSGHDDNTVMIWKIKQ